MANLNDEMGAVKDELDDVRELLREELPAQFDFDVTVGNIAYNANTNSISATAEPSSEARDQLSERFGGVSVSAEGALEFEFRFTSDPEADDYSA
ncbi:hypothetical protein [Natronobiforma cellulositropha]|uniref:hypothetical protein n=1 Tax=Natronobiforma cellulositropha TaxID=1679076 RepID=UPI0021D5CD43|nr:hypothetical protein [Natronobiforma cellulositropha]